MKEENKKHKWQWGRSKRFIKQERDQGKKIDENI
jgi:uncharacterized C2H2 Zn-finger protein